jgi:hypothetical protein
MESISARCLWTGLGVPTGVVDTPIWQSQMGASSLVGPAFGPFDEFHGQDEGDGEGYLTEALWAEPVGVAAELAEVG